MRNELERFQRDTAEHSMEVLHDDGLYRHLRFSRNGSNVYHFNITTWPGYLAITGDMGDFVFSRVRDMFEFFRDEPGRLGINPGYWAGKLQGGAGVPPRELYKEWDEAEFRTEIRERFDEHVESEELSEEAAAELWSEIEDEVLEETDNEAVAMRNAMSFQHEDFEFTDFFEVDCTQYTMHYLWCCYAIVWAIDQYDQRDALKKENNLLAEIIHNMVVANQSAWIEWQHGRGAEAAMSWIHNGLMGPGQIPDENTAYGKEPQAWFDANQAKPFPKCYCGRPSHQLWMGHGACCDEHMREIQRQQAEGGAS